MAQFSQIFSDLIDVYVSLEEIVRSDNIVAAYHQDERDVEMLLRAVKSYTGHDIHVYEMDFYDFPENSIETDSRYGVHTKDYLSTVLMFEVDGKSHSEIYLNSGKNEFGQPILNHCWRRFCIVKEACQIVLRSFYSKNYNYYPNTNTASRQLVLFHDLFKYLFSMQDFDSDRYPVSITVENASEIIAILLLYPADSMANDLLQLDNGEYLGVFDSDFFDIADQRKIPARYARLFLTSPNIPSIALKVWNSSAELFAGLEHLAGKLENLVNHPIFEGGGDTPSEEDENGREGQTRPTPTKPWGPRILPTS